MIFLMSLNLVMNLVMNVVMNLSISSVMAAENEKLNVMEGSSSKWSGQVTFSYLGAAIGTPFSEFAPNPGNELVAPRVILSGQAGLRQRLDEKSSWGVGFGLQVDTPFHRPQNFSMSNPQLDYAWSGEEFFQNVSVSRYTDLVYRELGYDYLFVYSGYKVWAILKSISSGLQYAWTMTSFAFDSAFQSDQSVGVYPFLEYQIKQGLSLRSTFSLGAFHNRNPNQWNHFRLSQTLGAGFAYSQTLYFYPYIQFYPSPLANLSSKETIWGASMTLNLF